MAKVIRAADVIQAEIHGHVWQRVLSLILVIVYAIIPLEVLLNESSIPASIIFPFLLYMSLLLYSAPLLFCMYTFIWYQVNDEGIRRHGDMHRLNFFVRWADIERIERTGRIPVYSIFLRGGKRIGFIPTTPGTSAFIILAKRHLPQEKWVMAFGEESPTIVAS